MSVRRRIRMSDAEVVAFLAEGRTLVCATNGRDGWPHLMPLWYVVRGADLWAWTYARSQKARNIERDPRVTLQVEAGEAYEELRGVMIKARAVVHRDVETVAALGREVLARHSPSGECSPQALELVRRQAPKRIGLQFVPEATASFDHRKLAEPG